MKHAILTGTQVQEIEVRFKSGTISDGDIELLLSTCRLLLSSDKPTRNLVKSNIADIPVGSDIDTARAGNGHVEIFADGACKGNPGPGGWGAIVRQGGVERELSGGDPGTTNNRMELTGAVEALKSLKTPCKVTLTTDSQYVQKGITIWIHGWKKNGWRTASKEPVKNRDLWLELDRLNQAMDIEWKWIKGHDGHRENERCDELARMAVAGSRSI